jgi:hypothetical protein
MSGRSMRLDHPTPLQVLFVTNEFTARTTSLYRPLGRGLRPCEAFWVNLMAIRLLRKRLGETSSARAETTPPSSRPFIDPHNFAVSALDLNLT